LKKSIDPKKGKRKESEGSWAFGLLSQDLLPSPQAVKNSGRGQIPLKKELSTGTKEERVSLPEERIPFPSPQHGGEGQPSLSKEAVKGEKETNYHARGRRGAVSRHPLPLWQKRPRVLHPFLRKKEKDPSREKQARPGLGKVIPTPVPPQSFWKRTMGILLAFSHKREEA